MHWDHYSPREGMTGTHMNVQLEFFAPKCAHPSLLPLLYGYHVPMHFNRNQSVECYFATDMKHPCLIHLHTHCREYIHVMNGYAILNRLPILL